VETGPRRRAAWSLVALVGGSGALLLAILGHAARAGAVQEGLLVPAVEALAVGRVELGRGIALVAGSGVRAVTSVPFPFALLAFLTGADLFIPTDPPGTVSVVTLPKQGGAARTVNVPNLLSTQARVVVNLWDFEP
jgi:hypothetical protein